MLVTLAVILIILWLLGLITSYTLGGFIHILLVLAIISLLVRFIAGRPGPPPVQSLITVSALTPWVAIQATGGFFFPSL